jgi:hypothetical protein
LRDQVGGNRVIEKVGGERWHEAIGVETGEHPW